jgi:hypothetical protein
MMESVAGSSLSLRRRPIGKTLRTLLLPAAGSLTLWDGIGSLRALTGMAVIMAAPRGT